MSFHVLHTRLLTGFHQTLFLPQSTNMHVRLIAASTQLWGVNVIMNGCLSSLSPTVVWIEPQQRSMNKHYRWRMLGLSRGPAVFLFPKKHFAFSQNSVKFYKVSALISQFSAFAADNQHSDDHLPTPIELPCEQLAFKVNHYGIKENIRHIFVGWSETNVFLHHSICDVSFIDLSVFVYFSVIFISLVHSVRDHITQQMKAAPATLNDGLGSRSSGTVRCLHSAYTNVSTWISHGAH